MQSALSKVRTWGQPCHCCTACEKEHYVRVWDLTVLPICLPHALSWRVLRREQEPLLPEF